MATGMIKSQLTIETGQATLLKTFTNVRANQIIKIGNLCFFQFNATVGQSIGAWVQFLTLPFDIEPGSEVQFGGVYNDALNPMSLFSDTNAGTGISGKAAMSSGNKISFEVFYISPN